MTLERDYFNGGWPKSAPRLSNQSAMFMMRFAGWFAGWFAALEYRLGKEKVYFVFPQTGKKRRTTALSSANTRLRIRLMQ